MSNFWGFLWLLICEHPYIAILAGLGVLFLLAFFIFEKYEDMGKDWNDGGEI